MLQKRPRWIDVFKCYFFSCFSPLVSKGASSVPAFFSEDDSQSNDSSDSDSSSSQSDDVDQETFLFDEPLERTTSASHANSAAQAPRSMQWAVRNTPSQRATGSAPSSSSTPAGQSCFVFVFFIPLWASWWKYKVCFCFSQRAPQASYTSTQPTSVAPVRSAQVQRLQRLLWRPVTPAVIWPLPAAWPGPTALSLDRSQTLWVLFPSTTTWFTPSTLLPWSWPTRMQSTCRWNCYCCSIRTTLCIYFQVESLNCSLSVCLIIVSREHTSHHIITAF